MTAVRPRGPHPLLTGLVAVIGVLFASCGGGGEKIDPRISSAQATRDFEGPTAPGLTSTVRVRFNVAVEPPDRELPLTSYFEVRVSDPLEKKPEDRVFVQAAEVVEGNTRTVDLHFARLVPDQAELRVSQSLFKKGATGEITASISSDLSPIQSLLAAGPLVLTDPSIIETGAFTEATAADRDSAAARADLERHLDARGTVNEARDLALARFDAMPEDIIPSPKLRAVLSGLTGTFADPAVENLLTSNNCTGKPITLMAFQDPPDLPGLFARVTHTPDGGRIISVSPRLEGAPIELLMPIIAHEAIHCDEEDGIVEEIAATSFDTLLYLQLLTAVPDVARSGSPLARELNVDAIAMINSGRALPESLGILPSPGVQQILPGSDSDVTSFAELVAGAYAGSPDTSPIEPLAQAYAGILAGFVGLPGGDPFDLVYLDSLLGRVLSPDVLLVALVVLGLQPPG
ncbi:MAG: hypothetical protein R3B97_10605 [Dehalococcoidia bacterium]|nr:hypothetical protein [Dehalococcoidia bacterium]MCB9484975.1 hypothetical protein [Thermoflexaceae bacterium]